MVLFFMFCCLFIHEYYQGIKRQQNIKDKNISVEKTACQMVYGCKWIVGTDYVYDYGKTTDMPSEKDRKSVV